MNIFLFLAKLTSARKIFAHVKCSFTGHKNIFASKEIHPPPLIKFPNTVPKDKETAISIRFGKISANIFHDRHYCIATIITLRQTKLQKNNLNHGTVEQN